MGQVRERKETGKLYLDFHYQGVRCREQTRLNPTATNLSRMEKLLAKIELEIKLGRFDYGKYFPESKLLARFSGEGGVAVKSKSVKPDVASAGDGTPLFVDFIEEWLGENRIGWRRSYQVTIRGNIDKYYLPAFGSVRVGAVTRADLLKFRSSLAKVSGRNGNTTLSANRINKIMDPLRRVFEEAADRYDFTTPYVRIKPLKVPKSDVQPLTLQEVKLIVDSVRLDFRNYYIVRFFTGMRTGEIDGLKWKYVDFERRQILIRETIVYGE